MIRSLATLACCAAMTAPATAQTEAFNALSGTIVDFQCGDNCYLTVQFGDAGQLQALCVAAPCDPWNEAGAIPDVLIGKPVTVELGVGDQLQAEDEAGQFIAFTAVKVDR